jgi:hypothetical protein
MGRLDELDLSLELSRVEEGPRPVGLARAVAATLAAALMLAGCTEDPDPFPSACNDGVKTIGRALAAAPGPVALHAGTKLSTCVHSARSSADIQTVGALYTSVADGLARQLPRSDAAALRLGYLVGAVRRGASGTNGIHDELVRRLEQSTGLGGAPAARRAAFHQGLEAGRRRG